MKIGIDGNEANIINRVGSGQYGFELLRHLVKIETSHQFVIYLKTPPLTDLPKERANWRYCVFGPKKFWTQIALPLNLYFRHPRPDVFFTPAHYAPRFSPIPVVTTIFDLSFLHFPEMFRKQDLYQLRNWTKYSVRKAAKILTISQSSKADIIKNYRVPEEKVVVTYPGVSDEFKPQSKSQIEAAKIKYQIAGEYILYVGTLQPRKNLLRLIEAFSKVISGQWLVTREKKPNHPAKGEARQRRQLPITDYLQLVIVGKKGWLYDEIFKKVKDLNLEGKVIFTDFVANEDLPALYSGAKVYVNVSLWEGFGIPVAESLVCGTPVVVSNTSSLPEVVGDAGILVNPESVNEIAAGILKILNLPKKDYQDLRKKSQEQALKFSWEKCAKETFQVLEKVASK